MDPNQRVGDEDRDAAVAALREHTAAGRLDMTEFDDRMTKALQARTFHDLNILFRDLPNTSNTPKAELVVDP
ncbi:MAG: hypothetical protein CR979_04130, partial [Propionibacterium sp.]